MRHTTGPVDKKNAECTVNLKYSEQHFVKKSKTLLRSTKLLFIKKTKKNSTNIPKKSSVKIIVDHRESRSPVMRFLSQKDIIVEPQQLDVGDYIISSRIGVERKTVDDFLNSLIEGKLFVQMKNLRATYSRPLLLIEGDGLLTKRNISHNAIFGSFVSIIVDFGIPIITTHISQETADFLAVMAHREQKEGDKAVAIRGEKTARTISEQQQFLVEGLPNISAVLAQRLLQHFGSIRSLANASEEDLCQITGYRKEHCCRYPQNTQCRVSQRLAQIFLSHFVITVKSRGDYLCPMMIKKLIRFVMV